MPGVPTEQRRDQGERVTLKDIRELKDDKEAYAEERAHWALHSSLSRFS